MAIQFHCPGCGKPIEVDEEWSGRSVACPYCRNTVLAPAHSTLQPPEPIRTARSYDPAPPQVIERDGNALATWGLGLAVVWLVSWFVIGAAFTNRITEAVGAEPTRENLQRYIDEHIQGGMPPDWAILLAVALLAELAIWLAGVVCCVLAVRVRHRRRLALVGLGILSLLPIFLCGSISMNL